MFYIDLPTVPIDLDEALISMVVKNDGKPRELTNRKVQKQNRRTEFWEPCLDVDSTFEDSGFNNLAVLHNVYSSLNLDPQKEIPLAIRSSTKLVIRSAPSHGVVYRPTPESFFWHYKPEPGYVGPDRVVFDIEVGNRRFRYTWNLLVHDVVDEGAKPPACESYFRNRSIAKKP